MEPLITSEMDGYSEKDDVNELAIKAIETLIKGFQVDHTIPGEVQRFEVYMKRILLAVMDQIGVEQRAYYLLAPEERVYNEITGEYETPDNVKLRLLKEILGVYYQIK
ncbi:hypothetical protein ACFYKX_11215 [Cytobacillus sp. FJAT-54145]|uniref:Uncharacterized protein n=1 Tax=Cytobacillus spartinae TaxID=3299023 RepID=A0ABW6KAG7_9BACI